MKKIKYPYWILLFFCGTSWSQDSISSDSTWVQQTVIALDQAFITKDTVVLHTLLHKDLNLGHSNGWEETKIDLLKTLIENGVVYQSIKSIGALKLLYLSENTITTRRNIDVSGMVTNKAFHVQLNVLEIWICETGVWQLLARQSVNRIKEKKTP
ncbi:MAG: hypothetical protein CVU03_11330 [Bacteroidetes bacterium HGW-Bacteroidetes-2]|jgi:hypothetical protein|nr:MAG: hypothetical protein CVU03_11330 [Bacteroidetes bacterium HGW-Bacteroidetes-2]